jgi:hypothetical protein
MQRPFPDGRTEASVVIYSQFVLVSFFKVCQVFFDFPPRGRVAGDPMAAYILEVGGLVGRVVFPPIAGRPYFRPAVETALKVSGKPTVIVFIEELNLLMCVLRKEGSFESRFECVLLNSS